jgi:hypothetical protein
MRRARKPHKKIVDNSLNRGVSVLVSNREHGEAKRDRNVLLQNHGSRVRRAEAMLEYSSHVRLHIRTPL